jgi:subtilisin family serine protease
MNCSIQGRIDDFATRLAVGYAVGLGVTVVAAMGNFGWTQSTPSYPAAYPGVFAVGAVDSNHRRSIWSATQSSNQGSWISVAAPGTNIASLRRTGGVIYMSGTSQAAPNVSGVLALLLSSPPTAPGVTAMAAITATCDPLRDNASDPIPNSAYGYGLVNAKAALDRIHPPVGDFNAPSTDTAVADASGSTSGTDTSTTPATVDTSATEPSGSVSTG